MSDIQELSIDTDSSKITIGPGCPELNFKQTNMGKYNSFVLAE